MNKQANEYGNEPGWTLDLTDSNFIIREYSVVIAVFANNCRFRRQTLLMPSVDIFIGLSHAFDIASYPLRRVRGMTQILDQFRRIGLATNIWEEWCRNY